MKKLFFILFSVIFFTNFFKAQSNFIPGTITKPDGTIVKGEIDFQNWSANPNKINFRATKTSDIQHFDPTEITAFSVPTKKQFYQSAEVKLMKETHDLTQLLEFETVHEANLYAEKYTKKENVFLLTLVKGAANLYTFIGVDEGNQYQNYFFIQKNNDSIIYLKNFIASIKPEKTTVINNSIHQYLSYIYRTKEYLRQLYTLSADCENVTAIVDSTMKYNESELMKCVQNYNTCRGNLTFSLPKAKSTASYYILGGVNLPSSTYNDDFVIDLKTTGSISPSIGVGAEFGLGRGTEKLGVELFYRQFKNNLYIAPPAVGYYISRGYVFNENYLNLNISVKHEIYTGSAIPYIKAGVGASLTVSQNNTFDPRYSQYYSIFAFSLGQPRLGVFFAPGIKINKFFLEGRYEIELENNVTNAGLIKTNYFSLYAGYVFSIK